MRATDCAVKTMAAFLAAAPRPLHGGEIRLLYPGLKNGVLYPMLRRWEDQGLLRSHWEAPTPSKSRPPRRYYDLTGLGLGQGQMLMANGKLTADGVNYAKRRIQEVDAAAPAGQVVDRMLVVEGVADAAVEDGGKALILTVDDDAGEENGVFVRVQSWSETGDHSLLDAFVGQRLRVTVEVFIDAP